MPKPKRYTTIRALSARWGMSLSTIERRVRDRTIPSLRIGRAIRILISDVEAIENNKAPVLKNQSLTVATADVRCSEISGTDLGVPAVKSAVL